MTLEQEQLDECGQAVTSLYGGEVISCRHVGSRLTPDGKRYPWTVDLVLVEFVVDGQHRSQIVDVIAEASQ